MDQDNWRSNSLSQRTVRENDPPKMSINSIQCGKIYTGIIKAIIHNSKRIGMYCQFGENGSVFDRDGFIRKITFNAKHGRMFHKFDEVKVTCISTNPIELYLTPEYVKPLLILDVNGPLGERSKYDTHQPYKREFIKRNYCKEFIEFCSKYYELAVWSCSRRNNIELHIFSDVNLYFVWSQDEATSLYPRTSVVSTAKPLFLKELSLVWEKFPSFNSSNTLLLENHIEKFERNIFGSGILCPEFDSNDHDDCELHPSNALADHLRAMATENPPNISQYVAQRAGTEFYFPTSYPVPPEDISSSDAKVEIESPVHATPGSSVTRPSDENLLMSYLVMCCNNNTQVAHQCIERSVLPGPKATPLHLKNADDVFRRSATPSSDQNYGQNSGLFDGCAYAVCEKTDGERAILVVSPEHMEIYFVYRNMGVQRLEVASDHQFELNTWMKSLPGTTVLDGELVSEYVYHNNNAMPVPRYMYLCFDGVFINGEFIGNKPTLGLIDRIKITEAWLLESMLNRVSFISPLCFQCKKFYPSTRVQEVVKNFKSVTLQDSTCPEYSGWGWVYAPSGEEIIPHMSDGLVFTPVCGSYYEYMVTKWKPPHMCTVDFALMSSDITGALRKNKSAGPDYIFSVPGHVNLKKKRSPHATDTSMVPLGSVEITAAGAREAIYSLSASQSGGHRSFVVAECQYVPFISSWRVYKLRPDRLNPNALSAAWSNLEVISEGCTLNVLLKAAETSQLNSIPPNGTVDAHYDRIQSFRQTGAREDRIAVHRRVMNWSKACLLHDALFSDRTPVSRGATSEIIGSMTSALKKSAEQIQYYPAPDLTTPSRRNHNKFRRSKSKTIAVLDIACGRGGDIKKFTSDSQVSLYVGVDVSAEQVRECKSRAKNNKRISKAVVIKGSAADSLWVNSLSQNSVQTAEAFDIAWCMFALHYFCASEESCRSLLSNISHALKPGGRFVATFPNPLAIHGLLSGFTEPLQSGDICNVSFGQSDKFDFSEEHCLTSFGVPYMFSLGDAVVDCEEFFVPLSRVVEIAESLGLHLVSTIQDRTTPSTQGMHEWIADTCLTDAYYLSLRHQIGVIGPKSPGRNVSDEEWRAIGLYMVASWEKVRL